MNSLNERCCFGITMEIEIDINFGKFMVDKFMELVTKVTEIFASGDFRSSSLD